MRTGGVDDDDVVPSTVSVDDDIVDDNATGDSGERKIQPRDGIVVHAVTSSVCSCRRNVTTIIKQPIVMVDLLLFCAG
jgi:hypothetical protein